MTVDNIHVIQATLAPVFLLTAAAIFAGLVQSRVFRVVDRLHARPDGPGPHALPNDARRLGCLRWAVLTSVTTMALTVLTAVVLLVPSAFPGRSVGAWPIWAFGAALVVFGVSLGCAVLDAWLATRLPAKNAVGPGAPAPVTDAADA